MSDLKPHTTDTSNVLSTVPALPVSLLSRRRFLKVASLAGLGTAALLAGCGPATSSDKVTLTHYNWQFGETGTHEAMLRYFSDYTKVKPNTTVNLEWVPGDYNAKLNAGLLSSSPPDVYLWGGADPDFIKAGNTLSTDDLLTPVLSDYSPQVQSAFKLGSHYYGVPTFTDVMFLYYRKSFFQKAGVKPPTTMAELADAAKALTTDKVKGLFVGNDNGGIASSRAIIWASGSRFITENKVSFATPQLASALTQLRSMFQAGTVLQNAPTDWYDPTVFLQGLVAMQYTGIWAMPKMIDALGDDVGVLPWPGLDASTKGAVYFSPLGFHINPKGKHVDETKAFLKWLWIDNAQKYMLDWSVGYGLHIPTKTSIAQAAPKLQSGLAAQALQIVAQYAVSDSPLFSGAMNTEFSTAAANIIGKGADPTTTLQAAQQKCQKLLDAYPTFS